MIDGLLDRQKSNEYHCVHFVIEAGKHLYDYDFSDNFLGLANPLAINGSPTRHTVTHCERVQTPSNGTVVLMTRFDNGLHVGLWHDGMVLHLAEAGVRFQLLRTLQRHYKRIRFYNAKDFSQSARCD